jgi:RimJ/RimL family protein N-acetyltransferase
VKKIQKETETETLTHESTKIHRLFCKTKHIFEISMKISAKLGFRFQMLRNFEDAVVLNLDLQGFTVLFAKLSVNP